MSEQKKDYLRPKVDSKGNVYSYEYDIFGQIGDTVLPWLGDRFKDFFTPAPTTNQATLNSDGSIGPKTKYKPRPSAKTQKTPPTPQAPEGSRGLPADYKETEQQARATAEAYRSRAGFTGTGRDDTRTNFNGVVQSGTAMGGHVMKMGDMEKYLGKDVQVKNPFLSNALPGTNDDGYSYDDAVAMGENKAEAATKTGGGEVQVTFESGKPIETKMVQGSPNLVLSGTGSAAPSDVKTNNPKDPSTWDENYARRRAFLDADSSMAGLKAAQAQKGIVYAGGQHNLVNPNVGQEGENDFVKIDRADAQAYMRGAQSAEDLKNKYIDKITNKTEEEEDNK